jgi:hypothetical protein
MKVRIALALLPVLMGILPAQAEILPNADDGIILWRNFQLTGPVPAAGPDGKVPAFSTNDTHVYFVKQWWATPNLGAYFFYGTQGTATARLQYKMPLFAGTAEDGSPTAPKLILTGMAGYRAIGMGNSLKDFSILQREGPEVALAAAVPLGAGLTLAANASYATVFKTTGTADPASLVFYGANLNWQFMPRTSAALGVLGAILAPFAPADATKPLIFHDLGPTLTLTQKF